MGYAILPKIVYNYLKKYPPKSGFLEQDCIYLHYQKNIIKNGYS